MFIYLVNKKLFNYIHVFNFLGYNHLEACESSRDDFILNIFVNVCVYVENGFKVYVNGNIDCLL